MKFKIIHQTSYNFTAQVFLEPHYFRFKPKTTPHITVEDYNLTVKPEQTGVSCQLDAENNTVYFAWFNGLHSKLEIHSEAIVEMESFNPFNFLIYPISFNTMPFTYPSTQNLLLHMALKHVKLCNELVDYGENILKASQHNTLQFITNLTIQIHKDFNLEYRHFGKPLEPDDTFSLRRGSCRDITWMQIHLMRSLGLATRFVSGYYYIPLEDSNYELHAWLEVFIPGAGWIGFDPSHGIMVAQQHIPVASSVNFTEAMPVTGTVRGDAESNLTTNLHIEVIKS